MAEGIELRRMAEEDRPYGALSAYEVVRDGVVVGVVAKHRTTTYRKAGRLIAATFHPLRWTAGTRSEAGTLAGAVYYSRRDAVDGLLRRRAGGAS